MSRKMASQSAALLTTLLLCVYGVPSAWCVCNNATLLSVQVDTLLAEYDRETPPSTQLTVQAALDVRHATIDQAQSVMRLLADLKLSWRDPRIMWNSTEWGCDSTLTAAERLWLPDLEVLNAAATSTGDVGLRARLDSTGAVAWISRIDVTAPVALALIDWPRDTQICTFKFGSRSYNSEELLLEISAFKHAVVFECGAWEIQSVSGESTLWQRGQEEVSVATWTVRLARRAPAHTLADRAVLMAAALMLATAVSLPPQQRYPLAACAAFTAALWLMTALLRVPGGAAAPRAVCVWGALCACGAACGAGAALVLRVARCSAAPPRALRALLSSLSTVCKLTPSPESCIPSESGAWSAAAVLADRTISAAILITLLVLLGVELL